jgi:hypothetical protein
MVELGPVSCVVQVPHVPGEYVATIGGQAVAGEHLFGFGFKGGFFCASSHVSTPNRFRYNQPKNGPNHRPGSATQPNGGVKD